MVDILLTTYNGEKYLHSQIDSIFAQTYMDWKIMIIDDCSTDKTCAIIDEYINKYPGKIEFYKNNKNSGDPASNFFKLLSMSKSDYVMFCDQDDVWLENKIDITINVMKNLESKNEQLPVLVHTDLKVVDYKLNVLAESMFKYQKLDSNAKTLKEIIVQNNVTGCTVMLNRKLVSMCCNIPENVIMHDWWVALIAAAFGVVGFANESTILYRQHESNQVGSKNASSILFLFNKFLHGGEIKKSILATYSQCEAFLGRYSRDLSLDQKSMLESYLMVACGNKLKRIKRLLCGGFLKYGFVRKLGQIIYV